MADFGMRLASLERSSGGRGDLLGGGAGEKIKGQEYPHPPRYDGAGREEGEI